MSTGEEDFETEISLFELGRKKWAVGLSGFHRMCEKGNYCINSSRRGQDTRELVFSIWTVELAFWSFLLYCSKIPCLHMQSGHKNTMQTYPWKLNQNNRSCNYTRQLNKKPVPLHWVFCCQSELETNDNEENYMPTFRHSHQSWTQCIYASFKHT